MALPVTPNHREAVVSIRGAVERLELGVFWVEAPARVGVRLAVSWQAARGVPVSQSGDGTAHGRRE